MAKKAAGYVILTGILREEEDGRWTSECLELGVAGYGDSLDEAKKSLEGVVALHLKALEKTGERHRFFQRHKITFHRATTKPKAKRVDRALNPGEVAVAMKQAVPAIA
jgi:predicted RNase H-like HicB family nuclease